MMMPRTDASLQLDPGTRGGRCGPNGAGAPTLLRPVPGEDELDGGDGDASC